MRLNRGPTATREPADTKERILAAAERMFSRQGYAASSLRSIIADAGVNLAAVHYHFGSKEELLRAVVHRRVGPVNEERLRLLDEYERAARGKRLPVRKVLEAFLAPAIRLSREPDGAAMVRMVARLYIEDALGELAQHEFGEVIERFNAALRRSLPELPERELLLRTYLGMGAVALAMRGPQTFPGPLSEQLKDAGEAEILRGLLDFLSAGFRAPWRRGRGSRCAS